MSTAPFEAASAVTFLSGRWSAIQSAVTDPSLLQSQRPEILTDKPPAEKPGPNAWGPGKQTGSSFLADVWRAAEGEGSLAVANVKAN